MDTMKFCSKCQITKPIDEFSKDTSKADGHRQWCQVCHAAHRRQRRIDNLDWAEAQRQKQREWYALPKNREARRDKAREHYARIKADPDRLARRRDLEAKRRRERRASDPEYAERLKRQQRIARSTDEYRGQRLRRHYDRMQDPDFREAFLEEQRVRKRKPAYRLQTNQHRRDRAASDPEFKARLAQHSLKWRLKFPDRARAHSKKNKARRRAAKREQLSAYTARDILKLYESQKGRCYYCGVRVGDTYHVEHVVPLSRGGQDIIDNLVISCPACNLSKGSKLPHEWDKSLRLL